MDGKGPYAIARILEADKIDIPAYHQQKLGYGLHQSKVFEYPYRWCSSTIASILKKQEYIGHTGNFKTRKHFKDKKSKYISEDNEAFFRSIQNEMEERKWKRKGQGSQMVKKASGTGALNVPNIRRYDFREDTE